MADMLRPVPVDIEPKRQNRWVLEFPADLEFSEWMVQTAARPNATINATEIPFMNISTWVAGRSTWDTLSVTFIDPIGPSATQKVMQWIRQCIEHSTGRMGYAVNYKKNLVLKMLDPAGETVEKWLVEGCFITAANFGSLDYSTDDLATVEITLQIDRAVLEF
jgi:hypothetical protein